MGNSAKGKTDKFNKLKYVIKHEIYQFFNFEDFLKFYKFLGKRFLEYFTNNNMERLKFLIIIHIMKEMRGERFLFISKYFRPLANKIGNLNEILSSLLNNYHVFLPIIGFKSEGGYQLSHLHYNNIFQIDQYTYHCSKLLYQNFPVFGSFFSQLYEQFKKECIVESDDFGKIKLGDIIKHFKSKKKIEFKGLLTEDLFDFIVKTDTPEDKKKQDDISLCSLVKRQKYSYSEENLLDDTAILKEFPNNDLIFVNSIYLRNSAEYYTCPGKTLIVYLFDDLNFSDQDHSMLECFKFCYDKQILRNIIMGNKSLFELRTYNNSAYEGREFDTLFQKSRGMNLRVMLWISLKTTGHHIIDLRPFFHLGKYVVIRFIDKTIKGKEGGNNLDFSKVHFFGSCIQLKSN